MNKTILSILLLFLSAYCFSQKTDSLLILGQQHHIESKILDEQREYWVHLPQSYTSDPSKKYPVVYLLDGEQNFTTTIGIYSFLSRSPRAQFPEIIIVGINNTDRTRDLTPTSAISKKGNATMENSGGGDQFFQFLQQELIPEIDQNFRTTARRVLIGHSFGGLFTINILLKKPGLFTDYLALDPSFWWDDQKLLKEAASLLNANSYANTKLFLARAGKKHSSRNDSQEDAKAIQQDFVKMLEENNDPELKWLFQNFENETHGTVFLIGTYQGLRYLFNE